MSCNIRVLAPKKWSNTERGTYFEGLVARLFTGMQFSVSQQLRVTGMEIDLLADHLYTKERALIECKFLSTPFEAPIISKLIGNAILREGVSHAYLVTTSKPGKDAEGMLSELRDKDNLTRGNIRFAFIGPEELARVYLSASRLPDLAGRLGSILHPPSFSSATLVITPEEPCWIFEETRDGVPERAYAVPVEEHRDRLKDFATFKKLIEENGLFSGLTIADGSPSETTTPSVSPAAFRDPVTPIPMADRFDDYGPARPQDFVGRKELLDSIWSYFRQVQSGEPKRRVIAISGPSGFGKSSIVLKLADRCHRKNWSKKLYIYHVDSRSAVSSLFVAEAIKKGFQTAVTDGFIMLPDMQVSVDSIEDPFSSESLQHCLSFLEKHDRLLVIFFDQFEELLVKEPLIGAFEAVRKAALAVEALKGRLILGFSWRTGISIPESHPAYYLWHSLQDKRTEFPIGPFSRSEATEMLATLEANLSQKLENPLRRHLLEQSQGLPWLLKKFCIHVYRQLSKGISQRALVESQLDASKLFQEDTQNLSADQYACLKYIAANSPVDLLDVEEKFGKEVADFLYRARLIVRTGAKYSVYWDIFKEYLTTDQIPAIPLTFIPQSQLSTALAVLKFIKEEGPVTVTEIEKAFGYTTKTVWNIAGDLYAFFLVKRAAADSIEIVEEFKNVESLESEVADYLVSQLERHVVIREFYEAVRPGGRIPVSEFQNLLAATYSSTTSRVYVNRILSWLRFAGLIEMRQPEDVVRPAGVGGEKGKVVIRRARLIDGKALFMCSSGPAQAIVMAVTLCERGSLSRTEIIDRQGRNPAQDLAALGLATWKKGALHPIDPLTALATTSRSDLQTQCAKIVKQRALTSAFLAALAAESGKSPNRTDNEISEAVQDMLGRDWNLASAQRYITAGKRWLSYFNQLQVIQGQTQLFDLST